MNFLKKCSENEKHEFISTWNWDVNNITMMHLELNWIKLIFLNWNKMNDIKLKTNEIQIEEENIQNLFVNMVLKIFFLEKHKRKHISISLHFLRMG
jgi:hypothetical protein